MVDEEEPNPNGSAASAIQLHRLKRFWGKRKFMTKAELFQELFSHPDIPRQKCDELFAHFSSGSPFISFSGFVRAVDGLIVDPESASPSSCCSRLALAESALSFREVAAGVTHFDVDDIVRLEQLFAELCHPHSWRIDRTTFSALLRLDDHRVEEKLFRFLSQGHEQEEQSIGFKEYVFGLSGLCEGPEMERLKFVAMIWDGDRDGMLSPEEHIDLLHHFNLQNAGPAEVVNAISVIDFICSIAQDKEAKRALIYFSNQIWAALTSPPRPASLELHLEEAGTNASSTAGSASPSSPSTPTEEEKTAGERRDTNNGRKTGKRRTVPGVLNIGNTCFIGAGVQALANVSPLSGILLSRQHLFSAVSSPFALNYVRMLRALCLQKETASPANLRDTLARKYPIFADDAHHDCHEFLQLLLDELDGEMKGLERKTAEEDGAKRRDKDKGEGHSEILGLFAGQLMSQIVCPNCGQLSTNHELFTMLQLQIPITQFVQLTARVVCKDVSAVLKHVFCLEPTFALDGLAQTVCERVGLAEQETVLLLVDRRNGRFCLDLSELLNHRDSQSQPPANGNLHRATDTVKDIPLADFDILCCQTDAPNSNRRLICVHRRLYYKPIYAVRAIDGVAASVFGFPIVLTFEGEKISGKQLYAAIWTYLTGHFRLDCQQQGQAGNGKTTTSRAIDASADCHGKCPFQLAFTKKDAIWCNKCEWSKFCRGCPIDPDDEVPMFNLEELMASEHLLTVNWDIAALFLIFNGLNECNLDDPSVAECAKRQAKGLTLAHCLDDFTAPETIVSRCDVCQLVLDRQRRLSISKVPNVLLVHFKRFLFVPTLDRYVKQSTPVSFPLDQLDMSPYLIDEQGKQKGERKDDGIDENESGSTLLYKCTGIVVHRGQLNHGHYTAYVRNTLSGDWFLCNDTQTNCVDEADIDWGNAYMLFYQRVDEQLHPPPSANGHHRPGE